MQDMEYLSLYVCPACKGRLEIGASSLSCASCCMDYPILEGIPDFLKADREQALGAYQRWLVSSIVGLYETPLWYVPILKLAGGKGAPSYAEVKRRMVEMMDVRAGRLLDAACGPGTWGRRLASDQMQVWGIDISWSMLRQGARVAENRMINAIHFSHAGVEALPFPDEFFDAAFCGGALHGFPDPQGALLEIGRTMKEGARLVVLTFLDRGQPLVGMRKRAEAKNDKLVHLHFFEPPQLEQMLHEAGFGEFEPHEFGGVIIFRARKTGE
jgi:ubiquinone/menaquinone biosynthesis C-methylase UbiE/uncharacterized protein YbaR (Trm112 family)